MPRRIKPRLGWRRPSFRPGVPDEQLKSIYTPTFLSNVANRFEIPSEAHVQFSEAVLRAGALYKQSKPLADDRPTLRQISKHFEEMHSHATELLRLLDEIDDASWDHFGRAEQSIIDEAIGGQSSAMQEVGAFRQTDPLEDAWEFYTHEDAPPVLGFLRLVCERARTDMPAPSRGPKRQIALRRWTAKMLDFWAGDLGNEVTIDYQSGSASSKTYDLLECLLKPLDPQALRYLATVLREERTRRRAGN